MSTAAATSLSEQDVQATRAEVAAGSAVTVWFTEAAVGVPAGRSAKVVSVGDTAEGDFIEVRAAGSRDTMFCSAGELTRTRPSRKRTVAQDRPEPAAAKPPAAKPVAAKTTAARPAPSKDIPEKVAPPPPAPVPLTSPQHSPEQPARGKPAAQADGKARANGAPAPAAPRERTRPVPRSAEVTVTLTSTPEGEWTVEVTTGTKRTVRSTAVQPGDVATAARALPPAVSRAISASLDAARARQRDRVERLRAELDAAQRALDELSP